MIHDRQSSAYRHYPIASVPRQVACVSGLADLSLVASISRFMRLPHLYRKPRIMLRRSVRSLDKAGEDGEGEEAVVQRSASGQGCTANQETIYLALCPGSVSPCGINIIGISLALEQLKKNFLPVRLTRACAELASQGWPLIHMTVLTSFVTCFNYPTFYLTFRPSFVRPASLSFSMLRLLSNCLSLRPATRSDPFVWKFSAV